MHYRYDVALSFAGEDRSHALALATRLQRAGFSVFFDRFEELWGQDLSVRLHEVYDRQCRCAVVFVSQHYLRRPWTNYERRVLVSRALREDPGFLLPIRLDDSALPGLPDVLAYKDARHESDDEIAAALGRLLAGATAPAPAGLSLAPSDFLYVVADPRQPGASAFNLGCLVVNTGPAAAALRHVEATVTAGGQCGVQYQWRAFYALTGRGAMFGLDQGLPLELAPGESQLIGLCFAGPPLAPALAWPEGPLTVDLWAWASTAPRTRPADVRVQFEAHLGADAAAQLAPWFAPPAGVSLSVAAAVPLAVTPRPGARLTTP